MARRSRTGTGVYSAQLIRELSNIPELQLDVLNGWTGLLGKSGLLAQAGRSMAHLLWYHLYLPFLIRKRRFDIFHGPAFTVPLSCACPSIVTIHDMSFRLFPHYFERRWLHYITSLMPAMLKTVSAVITVSQHSKSDLLSFYKIPSEKVHVIYNGINHSQFHSGATLNETWAKSMGLREGYVLSIGEISERKNIPTLLHAIAELRSKNIWRERQLVLAGPETPGMTGVREIKETIQQLEMQNIVIFTGRVPDEHVAGLYKHASLLAMPSLYEGFGLPVLESMAVGTPVVASNVSSLPEIAGDAAILVPPTDHLALAEAIKHILQNPKTVEQLRNR